MSLFRFFVVVVGVLGMGASSAWGQDAYPSQAVGRVPTGVLSEDVKAAAWGATRASGGKKRGGRLSTIGLELALLYHQYRAKGAAGVQAMRQASAQAASTAKATEHGGKPRPSLPVSPDGRSVRIEAVAADRASVLLRKLRRLGLEGGATVGNLVSGQLPIAALGDAAQLAALRGAMPSYMRTHAGRVESEADTAHSTYTVRANLGVDGSGQKVCVLSDSYDRSRSASTTAVDDIQSGDLPGTGNPAGRTTPVDVLDDDYTGRSPPTDEGRAMLQLVHDVAPGAGLGFHTAFGGVADFADGIRELANSGCTVIVDDVGSSIEPFYQDGPISNAVDEVVQNNGAAYFSAAGNDGQNSYEAPFRNSGQPGVLSAQSVRHDFDPSATVDTRQEITVRAGAGFGIFTFQWTDPSSIVERSAGADTDLDLALLNEQGTVVAQSARDNVSTGVPVEGLEYTNSTGQTQTLSLVIEKAAGPAPDEMKSIYFGVQPSDVEYDARSPTIYGHPMAAGALAVGAAPFYNTAAYESSEPAILEPFSSKGGLSIRFDQRGNALSAPVQRQKPEVVGADFIDNTFFGRDIGSRFGNDYDSFPNFPGTSAAAPTVAAVAALIRQARPGWSPSEVYNQLESTAADMTKRQEGRSLVTIAEGVDPWSGYGFVQGSAAVPSPGDIAISGFRVRGAAVADTDGSVTLEWRKIGVGTVDAFVVERRLFEGEFVEAARVVETTQTTYERTLRSVPTGKNTFRVTALRGGTPLSTQTVQATIGGGGASVFAYPNPVQDVLKLSVTLPTTTATDRVRIAAFDLLGRKVGSIPARQVNDADALRLDVKALGLSGAGTYFLRVEGSSFSRTVQVVRVP